MLRSERNRRSPALFAGAVVLLACLATAEHAAASTIRTATGQVIFEADNDTPHVIEIWNSKVDVARRLWGVDVPAAELQTDLRDAGAVSADIPPGTSSLTDPDDPDASSVFNDFEQSVEQLSAAMIAAGTPESKARLLAAKLHDKGQEAADLAKQISAETKALAENVPDASEWLANGIDPVDLAQMAADQLGDVAVVVGEAAPGLLLKAAQACPSAAIIVTDADAGEQMFP